MNLTSAARKALAVIVASVATISLAAAAGNRSGSVNHDARGHVPSKVVRK